MTCIETEILHLGLRPSVQDDMNVTYFEFPYSVLRPYSAKPEYRNRTYEMSFP